MAVDKKKTQNRSIKKSIDVDSLLNIQHNDYSGSCKVMIVEPVVVRAVTSAEKLPHGSYIKVTGTTYTLDLLGSAYSSGTIYAQGQLVTQGGFIYECNKDGTTGTFDAQFWEKRAVQQIGPVAITAGAVVSVGPWHNSATAAGFLVADDAKY
jgi:hypothetical protein